MRIITSRIKKERERCARESVSERERETLDACSISFIVQKDASCKILMETLMMVVRL